MDPRARALQAGAKAALGVSKGQATGIGGFLGSHSRVGGSW